MSEGYLITQANYDTLKQVNLLAKTIRYHDPDRPISVVTTEYLGSDLWHGFDKRILLENYYETPLYFKSCLESPYNASIVLSPNQILTHFNPATWENLLGMSAVVLPKNRFNFNNTVIDPDCYYHGAIEKRTFSDTSILNAVFYNRDRGAESILGLGLLFGTHYDQAEFIRYFKNQKSVPNFPKYVWPEWMMSFLYTISSYKINKFDFVKCIDLTKQENRPNSLNWNTRPWSEFLGYWVNETGEFKVENFIQSGLVNYHRPDWLNDNVITNLNNKYQ